MQPPYDCGAPLGWAKFSLSQVGVYTKILTPSLLTSLSWGQRTAILEAALNSPPLRLVEISTNPSGAIITLDGASNSDCPQSPCSVELSGYSDFYDLKLKVSDFKPQTKATQIHLFKPQRRTP
jgi:hypothetical protein